MELIPNEVLRMVLVNMDYVQLTAIERVCKIIYYLNRTIYTLLDPKLINRGADYLDKNKKQIFQKGKDVYRIDSWYYSPFGKLDLKRADFKLLYESGKTKKRYGYFAFHNRFLYGPTVNKSNKFSINNK